MTHDIKRRHDGSIDTAHYQALGRRARSDAFHAALRQTRAPRRALPHLHMAIIVIAVACLPLFL
jgi:hypothetical protein